MNIVGINWLDLKHKILIPYIPEILNPKYYKNNINSFDEYNYCLKTFMIYPLLNKYFKDEIGEIYGKRYL